jgi:hypothetical protein
MDRSALLTRLLSAVLVAVIILAAFGFLMMSSPMVTAEDYNFSSEDINEGYSIDPTERYTENADYNELVEGDQYADTNFSGSSEDMTLGTAGGGSFPSALDTDDTTRRSYTEEDTGVAPPSPYTAYLFPNGDSSVGWDNVYPSDGVHYTKVDETTVDGDGSTTYVSTGSTSDEDRFNMADLGDPGTGYSLDVTFFAVHQKDANPGANFQGGIRIGTTNYIVVDLNPANGAWTNTSGATWTVNPSTTAEWTYAEVDALLTVITTDDASPTVYCTQVGLKVDVTFSGGTTNYELDGEITFSSVTSTSQTTGYKVFCQGYRSGAEDFAVYAWDYVATGWNLKDTIDQGSDYDFDFALTADERDGTGNEVIIRFLGLTETGDTTQDILYFDVLKVSRIETGYSLDIEMSSTGTNEYGEQRLRIKAYTTAEEFYVDIYNWTTPGWDLAVITVSALSNTWYTYDLYEPDHRSGGEQVDIRFRDADAATADTTQDTCYLDVAWISWIHTDPEGSDDGCDGPKNVGEAASFWVTVTDADNEVMSYVRVNIGGTDYDMLENNSGDTDTWDSKAFYFSKSDIPGGTHDYYFRFKDANSGEITTAPDQVTINRAPTLTVYGVFPGTGNNGDTFYFYCNYTDLDDDAPDYIEVVIASTPYTMTKNDSGDSSYDDGVNYSYDKVMAGGLHSYYFRTADYLSAEVSTTPDDLSVNNKPTLSGYNREPGDPCYPNTLVYFNVTYTDIDGDLPSSIKWREDGGSTQNITMDEVSVGDEDVTDGKDYTTSLYLSHGVHNYDFYASDGMGDVSGGSNSVTIQNRDPIISNGPGASPSEWRNTAWNYDFDATDPDDDTVGWEVSGPGWLTINPSSGYLSGTTPDATGDYDFTVYANDSYGGSDSYPFTLSILNRAPVINNGPGSDPSAYRNVAWNYDFDATDADTDTIGWELSGPAWLTINPSSGYVSGTTTDTPGNYGFTVYANDSYGGSDDYPFTLHITNRIPVIDSSGNTTQQLDTFMCYHVVYHDDDGDGVTLEFSSNATWLSLSNEYVNGTATPVGWYWCKVWANDSYGGSDLEEWDVTVTEGNQAPYFTSTPVYTVANNTAYYYDANATDPDSDPITYGLQTDCPNLEIDDETGEVTGTPDFAGDYFVNVTADDGENPPAYQNFSLSVTTTPPSFTSSPIESWQHGTTYTYDADATDPEGEDLLFDLEGNGTAFLTIIPGTGVVSGIPPAVGYWHVNISVTDYTHVVWQNFTLSGLNTNPTITTSPVLVGYIGVPYYYDLDATDANSDGITYDLYEHPTWLFIDDVTGEIEGTPTLADTYDVKARAYDGYGYTWQNYSIVVGETPPEEPPEEPEPPAETTVQARFTYTVIYNRLSATDGSFGPVVRWQWSFGDGFGANTADAAHTYEKPGTYTLKLTVYDAQGRTSVAVTTVEITMDTENVFQRGDAGWDVYISGERVFTLPALALLIGALVCGATARFGPEVRFVTKKARWVLAVACALLAFAYYLGEAVL